jgi:hypothetical protein
MLTNTISITFTNTNPGQSQSFKPLISRPDELDLNGNDVFDAGGNVFMPTTNLAVPPLAGSSKTYTGTAVYNNYPIVDYTVGTVDPTLTDYQGGGNLSFDYIPTTFVNNVPVTNVTSSTPIITDHLTFQVTYSYCQVTSLATNIMLFTATKENGQSVALNWITSNEVAGRRYDIGVSTDGRNFHDDGSVPADSVNSDAAYSYHYVIPAGRSGKLYFRLRQWQANGVANYSQVRSVDLGDGESSAYSLYPNPPSDYINLNFPATGDWKVDILAADGGLVQRVYYPGTNLARLSFSRKLSAGTYFARATDSGAGRSYIASFTIR